MSKLAVGILMLCAASQAVGGQVAFGQTDCRLVQTDDGGWACADSSPGSEPDSDGGSGGGGSSGCTWTSYRPTLVEADNNSGFYDDPGFDGVYDGSTVPLTRTWADGRVEEAYSYSCPGSGARIVWVDTTITPRELAERAFAQVVVPRPVVAVSPIPEAGGVVNLGLWLAIEEQPELRDSESEGSVSIELIGEYQGMTWDFGNGDTVTCDDFGEQYPEGSNDPGEGPCGYTYTQNDGGEDPVTVTVTTLWSFRFTSSSDSGPLGDLPGETSFQYQIREIQTVGTGDR